MKQMGKLSAGLTLWVLALSGCDTFSTPVGPGTSPPDVYAGGYQNNGSLRQAIYWKNGKPTVLSDGGYGAIIFDLVVSNGHVYAAGVQGTASGREIISLWTDGAEQLLTDGTTVASVGGLFVDGNDVYVSGSETANTSSGPEVTAEYWKNGVKTVLATEASDVEATVIALSGQDVYVAGSEIVTTQIAANNFVSAPAAVLWKNGVKSYVTTGASLGEALGIALSGSDVYLAGTYCITPATGCNTAVYWKNGAMVTVEATQGAIANGIAVSGTNVTVPIVRSVGSGNSAELWSSGKLTNLSASQQSSANAAFAYGSDIYVGGADNNIAVYWKNGTETMLGTSGTPSTILAMSVVEP